MNVKVDVICENCGIEFQAMIKERNRGKARCCSASCANSKRRTDKGSPRAFSRTQSFKTSDPYSIAQSSAQRAVKKAIITGLLKRQPCEVCGEIKVDAHHDDYSKKLEVRWLCRSDHLLHHRRIDKNNSHIESFLKNNDSSR